MTQVEDQSQRRLDLFLFFAIVPFSPHTASAKNNKSRHEQVRIEPGLTDKLRRSNKRARVFFKQSPPNNIIRFTNQTRDLQFTQFNLQTQ
jgi:hypothetical protein